jgi:hypothetical protein
MDIANLKLADFTRPEILNNPYPSIGDYGRKIRYT